MKQLSIFAALAIGCASGKPTTQTPQGSADVAEAAPTDQQTGAGEDEDDSTADLAEHHRHHHHGGFAMFIAMSLDSIGVNADQTAAIKKLQADMHAKMQPAHDAEKAVLLALADGVAEGKIDRAKIDPAIAQLSSASASVHDAMIASLNSLHGILTPPQRQALVDKVEAHADVWHHLNTSDEPGKGDHDHFAELAKHLSLSPDQVEKIRASFTGSSKSAPRYDRAEADEHLKMFATSFASETFDAKTLTKAGAVNARMATWGIGRTVRLYEAAAPVLTPEQRTKAAETLRRHANYKRTDSES
jgi:Spy/CpxP family protein refolding chaperone